MALIKELELIRNTEILQQNEIVIYGAGNYGRLAIEALEEAGISVFGVCDSDVEKWGEVINNEFEIMSPMELKKLYDKGKILVIIAINSPEYVKQVLKMLDYCGMNNIVCCTYFALKYALLFYNPNEVRLQHMTQKVKYINAAILERVTVDRLKRSRFLAIYHILTKNAILIFQCTKVGSATVYHSLIKAGLNSVHTHFINADWLPGCISDPIFHRPEEQKEAIRVLQNTKNIKIITLVREPIGRDISQFFEAFTDNIIIKRDYYSSDMVSGIEKFIDELSYVGELGYQFEWFNKEIKQVFGVDIYKYHFDREKGYGIIKENNVEILLLKMEKLNQCEKVIGEFAGADNFKLEIVNTGRKKLYHFAYEELKREIRIPRYIVDRYYKNNSAMDHFYTEEEKAAFLDRWANNIIN